MQFKPVTLARRTAATPQTVTWVDAIRNVRLRRLQPPASRKQRPFIDASVNPKWKFRVQVRLRRNLTD